MSAFQIKHTQIKDIGVGERLRGLQPDAVESIAESISKQRLYYPVIVEPGTEGRYTLLDGNHRLEACKLLGWSTIPAYIIHDAAELEQMLAEIDTNFIRADLSDMDKDRHILRRKELYELKFPETKQGATALQNLKTLNEKIKMSFSGKGFVKDASKKLGVSEPTVKRALRRAKNIAPEIQEAIEELPAVSKSIVERDALAGMTPSEQKEAIEAVKTGAVKNVREFANAKKPGHVQNFTQTNLTALVGEIKPAEADQVDFPKEGPMPEGYGPLRSKIPDFDPALEAKKAMDQVIVLQGTVTRLKAQNAELRKEIERLKLGVMRDQPENVVRTRDGELDLVMKILHEWKHRALRAEEKLGVRKPLEEPEQL